MAMMFTTSTRTPLALAFLSRLRSAEGRPLRSTASVYETFSAGFATCRLCNALLRRSTEVVSASVASEERHLQAGFERGELEGLVGALLDGSLVHELPPPEPARRALL